MAYNAVTNRVDAAGTIPVETSMELVNTVQNETSFVMRLGRKLRNMTAYETDMPVLDALASAHIQDGDTELVETDEMAWRDVKVYAKDVTVFLPVPKNVLSDAKIPIWSEMKPVMTTAAGKAIDLAMLYGTGKPALWPTAIVAGALAAGHNVSLAAFDDVYDAILGEDGVFTFVENDGFGVTGSIGALSMKGKLRGCRGTDGQPIFTKDPVLANTYNLDGTPIYFPLNGAGSASYPLIAGDWSQLVYSVRQDIEFEIFTEGVVQDQSGKIIFNLMQQRMAAMMMVMRVGFAVPNPVNWVNSNSTTRYPWAYLTA